MQSNIVLIDYENVQPVSLQRLASEHFRVFLFIGAKQKLPVEIDAAKPKHGVRVERVKITGKGRNALDFHIAYYIGVHSASDPSAYFYIVSRDTGFDPLIQHLNANNERARRVNAIHKIPIVKVAASNSHEERVQSVMDTLAQPKVTKPSTRKKLSNFIASYFQKQQLSDEQVAALVAGLAERGFLSVAGTKITYAATSDA